MSSGTPPAALVSNRRAVLQRVLALKDSARVRVLLAAVASAVTWFAWAFFANRHDLHHAWLSGLSQGAVSFITTSIGSGLLEVLYRRMGNAVVGRVFAVVLVSGCSLAFMLVAHTLAHTPNPVLTIAPVFTVVVLYCSSYIVALHRLQRAADRRLQAA